MLSCAQQNLMAHTNSYDFWNVNLDDKLPFRNITYVNPSAVCYCSGKLEIE